MPTKRPVTLVVWRSTGKEQPGDSNRGVLAVHPDTGVPLARPAWTVDDCDPWWAEMPVPPSEDALTLDDLRAATDALMYAAGDGSVVKSQCRAIAARLRRAIEAAEATT